MGNSCCGGGGGDDDNYSPGGRGRGGGQTTGLVGSGNNKDTYHSMTSGRVQPQPDPEEKRRHLLEAAEKRRQEAESRGVKNVDSVKRQQQRKEEMERRETQLAQQGIDDKPVLRWQV